MEKDDRKAMSKAIGVMTQLGFTVLACMVINLFIGYRLDQWLNTAPIFLIIFTVLGCGASIKAMIDLAKKV